MRSSTKPVAPAALLLVVALLVLLLPTTPVLSQADEYRAVPEAQCGPGDRPETGLQGQVPWTERAAGFSGFSCNLELVGQHAGDGAGWQHAWYGDCAYYGGATGGTALTASQPGNGDPRPLQDDPGTAVIDASDPANPQLVRRLTTASMIDPWESLKAHQDRGILAAVNSNNGSGGPELDVYDVSSDCTDPRLLSSESVGTRVGHAGNLSADGTIYYGSPNGTPKAVDITDPTAQKLLTEDFPLGTHDLSTSADGTRLYLARTGNLAGASDNGLVILDVSEVQARREDPQVEIISELYWPDGAIAQMTQPITIGEGDDAKPYILFVDEGAAGLSQKVRFCQEGLPPYAFARLIDISDERTPTVVSKLMLETHLPANCPLTAGDAQGVFQYDSHYCTASDGVNDSTTGPVDNAVIVACGYFESGLRVFDVRDPANPREIAYYNPPARPGYHTGSYFNLVGSCDTADWTASHPRIRADRGEIWFTSQCNGFQIVKFTNDVWPLGPLES